MRRARLKRGDDNGATPLNFDELGLRAELLEAVRANGYDTPTPVQELAIPIVLQGRDLMAAAQTGTGKTAGFTLPLLHKLMETHAQASAVPAGTSPQNRGGRDGRRSPKRRVRALVLVPTRELAAQVQESVKTYGGKLPLNSMVIFGGVGMQPQLDALRRGVDIVVATPGRLLDHAGSGNIDLSSVEFLVLDEADRMLDMGFIHDIKRVLKMLPPKRQNLLFSATFADEIKALAEKLLDHPELVEVTPRNTAAETVEQGIYRVDRERKGDLLAELVHRGGWSQVLVFTRTKHGANRLAQKLERDGITAAAIHGNKSQNARTKALADFKGGGVRVLVATDIAARGLDIDTLPHVVNFELPFVAEDYVHRIGRTGRAGATGHAVSLVCVDENRLLQDIEKLLNRRFDALVLQGFEPDPSIAAEPLRNGRGGGGGRSGGGRPGGGRSGGGRPGGPPRAGNSGRPGGARPAGGRSGGQGGQGSGGRRRSPAR